jgi:hypothetical protein
MEESRPTLNSAFRKLQSRFDPARSHDAPTAERFEKDEGTAEGEHEREPAGSFERKPGASEKEQCQKSANQAAFVVDVPGKKRLHRIQFRVFNSLAGRLFRQTFSRAIITCYIRFLNNFFVASHASSVRSLQFRLLEGPTSLYFTLPHARE